MKFFPRAFFRVLLAAPLAALLVAGAVVCVPGQAAADDIDYDEMFTPLAGKASGNNGLTVSWTVKHEVPGREKAGGEDTAWLMVTPALDGKKLPFLHLEGDYAAVIGMADMATLSLVTLQDYNFDGHDDMSLVEGVATRGLYMITYLFNPESGGFEKSEPFSTLQMIEVDKKRKRLITQYHEGAFANSVREYVVKGFDTLELVFEEGTESPVELLDNMQYRSFRREYRDGKLVSEKTELHTLEEAGQPVSPAQEGGNSDGDGAENPDLPLDAPVPAATTPFSGKGIRADLPDGWTAKIDGETVVFSASGGVDKGFVMAAVIPLPSNKHSDFLKTSKEIAKNMQGKNVQERNGVTVEFDLPNGAKAVTEGTGRKSLLLGVFLGNDPVSADVLRSVRAAD